MVDREQAAEIVRRTRDDGVRWVHVIFLDYNGLPRARGVAIDDLADALQRGVNFSSPTVDLTPTTSFPPLLPSIWRRPISGRAPIPSRTGWSPTTRAWRR